MAKSFTIKNSHVAVLVTLMVFVFLGACYFFIYVPNNEKVVQGRHFRCLENINDNINSKIDNSLLQVQGLVNINGTQQKALLDSFIKKSPKNNFILTVDTVYPKPKGRRFYTGKSSIVVDTDTRQISLFADTPKLGHASDTAFLTRVGIHYGFKQFILPLLPAGNFEKYIVFYKKKAVYQTFASGLSYTVRDSILKSTHGIIGPGFHSVNISGTDYKVFSQPVNIGNNEWIIAGLVSNKDYQKEKNQLPLGIVLLLLSLAIGIIILLPWIKLYHMGNKDKLTITDGISSVLIAMLLMSLLFFFIFKYSFYSSLSYKHFSNSKDILPNQMITAFEKDVYTANNIISGYDAIHSRLKSNLINLETKKAMFETSPNIIDYKLLNNSNNAVSKNDLDSLTRPLSKNVDVNQVYWLNMAGSETENWITTPFNAPHTNYKSRAYFTNTSAGNPRRTGPNDFYLEQIISRTTGDFATVIAKNATSGYKGVVAMSFVAKSLDTVLMPDGYQYAIIDSLGEVLYHSIKERNLNENLVKEFADSSKLVSAIEAKSDTGFTAEYYGRQYTVKIKPFPHLPYFMVVFEDFEYRDARDTESYSFTLSMLVFLLVFMIIQVSVVFFVSSRKSFFKKQLFDTSWIGPKINSHRQYNLAIIANLAIMVLLIVFFDLSSFLKYLYIILFSITFISIFLNGIFAIHYKEMKRPESRYFKLVAVTWLCGFVLIIDMAAFLTIEGGQFFCLLGYELLVTATCIAVYYFGDNILAKVRNYKLEYPKIQQYWTYTHSFALMATTRLVITSGIPVAFFFIYSFNYEQNLDTRYRQVIYAEALAQRPFSAAVIDPANNRKDSLAKITGVYYDGAFIQLLKPGEPENIPRYTKEDLLMVNVFNYFRVINNDLELKSNNMVYTSVGNRAFFKNKVTDEHPVSGNTTITNYKIAPGKFVMLSSGRIDYPFPPKRSWILLIISLVIFYYMIHNIIRKLFALNLPSTSDWGKLDENMILDNELNKLLFILGSPGSGKLTKLKKKLNENKLEDWQEQELLDLLETGQTDKRKQRFAEFTEKKMLGNNMELLVFDEDDHTKSNVFIADMINISTAEGENCAEWKVCKKDAFKEKNALIIINHFEYNIKDPQANSIKLDFLEALMLKGATKLMIISTIHPLTFLDSFNEEQANGNTNVQSVNAIPESELQRWHVLLGHFRIVIEPLNDIFRDTESTLEHENRIEKHRLKTLNDIQLEHAISIETRYSHYLNNMKEMAIKSTPLPDKEDVNDKSDALIFKLQITSHYFYTYIWQSLTKEEKFLLYDLAEDGLVNPYDDYNLSMLISKGIIIKNNGTLMLFNRGFRNFILTAIGNTELNRIKDQVKDNGNWNSLKTPLIIAILAILVFLIASQQEAYSRIITYITALGAGVPAVLKIFSLFPNNTQKAS